MAQALPKITSVWPEWVQRGTTSVIGIEGENLSGIIGFIFSGQSGLTATNGVVRAQGASLETSRGGIVPAEVDDKKLRISVTVSADAALGPRELRIVTAGGVSSPVTLNVGFLRELTESQPNNSTNDAQFIELPAAINGYIHEAAESEYYRFKARKGERLIFDVVAFRAGSPLDSSLAVFDLSGKELSRSEDVNGLDSLIDFQVPADAEYLLQIRDFRFQGGKDYKYRIVAGELPYLDSIFPLGGQRGQPVEVALRGRNLDELSKLKLRVEPEAPLGQQEIRANTTRGYSNPILFAVGDATEFLETEPNNTTTNANSVKVPVTINGRIGGEKDVDQFAFQVEKGQALIFEVFASRYGSPLDAVLTLTDKDGKTIAENDDSAGADARIEQTFAEAGQYIVRIRDLLNRGGEDFGYRLMIHPPVTDFSVSVSPDTPIVSRGSYTVLSAEVRRQGGFGGPVEVWIEGLPEGVSAGHLVIPSDSSVSPLIVLQAAEEVPLGHHRIKFVAAGVIGSERVTRDGKPETDGRITREAFLTVQDRSLFTLEPLTVGAQVLQNQSVNVECQIHRQSGFTGEIQVSAEGFSSGRESLARNFDAPAVTVKASDSRATLNLRAKSDSEIGTRMILFKGEAKIEARSAVEYSRAIPLTVEPIPFVLASSLPRLAITAAAAEKKSAASEAEFTIRANRRGWFDGDISLSVEGLPDGLGINSTNIVRGAGEAAFKLSATDKAPVGKDVSLVVVGNADTGGRHYQFRAEPVKVTINAPETMETPAVLTPAAKKE